MSQSALDEEVFTFNVEDMDWEIICDIAKIGRNGGWPPCPELPAQWIAFRANCCPNSPRYRLICDDCKLTYQKWAARQALITCGSCGAETGGFLDFVPLKRKS